MKSVRRGELPRLLRWAVGLATPADLRDEILDELGREYLGVRSHGRREALRWLRTQFFCRDWLALRPARRRLRRRSAGFLHLASPPHENAMLDALLADLTSAFRSIRHRRRLALTVSFTIAIGIVGATTLLGVIDAVLLQPLPYAESDRLVAFEAGNERQDISAGPVSLRNLEEWTALPVFTGGFAMQGTLFTLGGDGPPESLGAARVSPRTLEVLGVEPQLGRAFAASESVPGNDHVVLVSHEFWRTRLAAEPGAVGRDLLLDDVPHRIVGVLPAGFRLPVDLGGNSRRDLLVPLAPEFDEMPRSRRAVAGYGRLAPGVSLREARDAVAAIFLEQTRLDADANEGYRVQVRPLVETVVGPFRVVLMIMLGASLLLLGLACTNLVNLLLASCADRRREFGVRAALGAGRTRIVRTLALEGTLLGLAGGLAGLGASQWLLLTFTRLTPEDVPRLQQAAMSGSLLAGVTAAAVVIGGLVAGFPALLTTGEGLLEAIRGAGSGAGRGPGERRFSDAMVVVQVGLAVVLLIGAGLLARSFARLVVSDPGFETDGIVTALLVLPSSEYSTIDDRSDFVRATLEAFESTPGIERAGVINFLPYSGTNTIDGFSVRDQDPGARQAAGYRAIDAGYLDVLGLQLVEGRLFTSDDLAADRPVALVSRGMADRYFEGSPVGRFIRRGGSTPEEERWLEIVGVVEDVRHEGPGEQVSPEWYAPYTVDPYTLKTFVMRTRGLPADVIPAVRDSLATVDPDLAPFELQTMADYLDEHVARPRFNLAILGAFAAVALIIATLGMFSVVAHSVTRRVREMGVRMALGAAPVRLRNRVLADGMRLAAGGILFGALAAWPLGRGLTAMLHGVDPTDPATFVAVVLLALAASGAAAWLPARRAVRIDPVEALREPD